MMSKWKRCTFLSTEEKTLLTNSSLKECVDVLDHTEFQISTEILIDSDTLDRLKKRISSNRAPLLRKVDTQLNVLPTGIPDVDELCGGGLMRGGITILSGLPGAGKSQVAYCICAQHRFLRTVYCDLDRALDAHRVREISRSKSSPILSVVTPGGGMSCRALLSFLEGELHRHSCELVVLDSVSGILDEWKVRESSSDAHWYDLYEGLTALAIAYNVAVLVTVRADNSSTSDSGGARDDVPFIGVALQLHVSEDTEQQTRVMEVAQSSFLPRQQKQFDITGSGLSFKAA